MARSTSNTYVNPSKTYKVDRLLPERSTSSGWAVAYTNSGALAAIDGQVPRFIYPDSNSGVVAGTPDVALNLKSTKPGESQYLASNYDGLSPVCCVKVATKHVADVYGYSVLSPEKLNNKIPGVQVLVSLEELFRASRITKVTPASGGDPETYECNTETGHLPLSGWICVRVPKHMAVSEEMIQAYICDLLGTFTTNAPNGNQSVVKTILSLARGDVRL